MGLSIGASGIQTTLLINNSKANKFLNQSTERLSTGLRINHARDDPAGLIGAEKLRGDLVDISANLEVNSAQRGQVRVQQSGRQIASDVLREVRGLLVQASGNTNSKEEQAAIQLQIDASLDSLDLIGSATGFSLDASLENLRSGESANVVDGEVAEAVELIDEQLSAVNLASVAAGAYEKYTLDVDQRLAEDRQVATAAALSSIADADYARESSNLVIGGILAQSSIKTQALYQRLQLEQVTALFDNLA